MGEVLNQEVHACAQGCAGCSVKTPRKVMAVTVQDPREDAFQRLPMWAQPVITAVSCKPTKEELIVQEADPVERVIQKMMQLTVSTAAVAAATATFSVWSIPVAAIAALFAVGALRDFQLSSGHEASHQTFFTNAQKKKIGPNWRKLNEFFLELSTTVSFSANGKDYRGEHGPHHDKNVFMTPDDPDAKLLLLLGFKPGMSMRQLWRHFFKTALSPSYHGQYMWARFRSNVITAKGWRRVAGIAWISTLIGLVGVLPFWSWFFAIFMVWGPLWQVSALMQFCSEHPWLSHDGAVQTREAYAEGCHARFSWLPLPSMALTGLDKAKAWFKWSARMLFVELPVRIAVVPNTLAAHDAHHLCVWSKYDLSDWGNSHIHRQIMIEQGDQYDMASREHWGIGSAMNRVFKAISQAKPV
jgi:fatty acid desaturase